MRKIVVHNFATISDLELVFDKKLDVVIGAQASGKSTLAKLIYYCRKIKDYVLEYLVEPNNFTNVHPNEYYSYFVKHVRKQFMGCFGTTKHMPQFQIDFYYNWNEKTQVNKEIKKASFTLDEGGFVRVSFSKSISDRIRQLIDEASNFFVNSQKNYDSISSLMNDLQTRKIIKEHFSTIVMDLFEDTDEIIYIPAGRSVLATLSEQLHDLDVSIMDLPLRDFIHLIKETKKKFGTKIPDIISNYTKTVDAQIKNKDVEIAYDLVKTILKGDYVNDSDGEKLYYGNHQYVKLMYASSGQQEVLWILLLIFIKILEQQKVFVVIEEPEAHLFPMAQKSIVELIALLINSTNSSVFVTTHSPYILSSVNLLAYSAKIENRIPNHNTSIVRKMLRISPNEMHAFMISNKPSFSFISIKDSNEQLIDTLQIDKVSDIINSETEKILDLEIKYDL